MLVSCGRSLAGTQPNHSRGFTLLELLVVLVIIALVAAVVVPSLARTPSTEMQAAARSLATGLRAARSEALTRNRSASLTIDLGERWFRVGERERHRPLPEGAQLVLYTARSELQGEGRGSIRFFADGSSTGGRITLKRDRLAYAVDVDWLTGRVELLEGEGQASGEIP